VAVDDWEPKVYWSAGAPTVTRTPAFKHRCSRTKHFSYRLGASVQQLNRNEPGTREQDQNSDRYQGNQRHTAGARELAANSCRSGATTGSVDMTLRSGGHGRS
jgi:hypothetical protein